jgi:hypothetical protein
MKPKLRFYEVTGRSARGMDAAMRNAMQAVERALAEDGGWLLVRIKEKDFPADSVRSYCGRMYNRKTDEYQLSCWMIQYRHSRAREGIPQETAQ